LHGGEILKDLVVISSASVLVVGILRRFGIPSIAGFILAGAIAGPNGLGLIEDTRQVEVLAEVGVILLLFGIGLELSLDRIRQIWKWVLLGGGLQVSLTIGVTAAVAVAFGLAGPNALFVGFVVAVSSTAIVLRGLSVRGELETPYGRLAVGILIFQDLCVVPMMLVIPFLSGEGASGSGALQTIFVGAFVIAGVLVAARVAAPALLALVAQTRERDLFILTVFLICFGIAWTVSHFGVSIALGAFLAGLVVASSEFRHQALADLIPVREVLASLFFVSVGMLLNVGDVLSHVDTTLGLLLLILVGKFALVVLTAVVLRLPFALALQAGATLCQVGEFSFVLLAAGQAAGLVDTGLGHDLLVAIILSMLLTPLGIALGPHLANRAAKVRWLSQSFGTEPPPGEKTDALRNHVIVVGYGFVGGAVCAALQENNAPFVLVDTNPDNIRAARRKGILAVLGDITQASTLEEAHLKDARLVLLSINDFRATEAAVHLLRQWSPETPITIRTRYESDRPELTLGHATVITDEAMASKALVESALEVGGRRTYFLSK
jgi:monovalent cation:H+ antiporter-2, CPA2 family